MIKITTVNDMVFQGEEESVNRSGTWLILKMGERQLRINRLHIVCIEDLK